MAKGLRQAGKVKEEQDAKGTRRVLIRRLGPDPETGVWPAISTRPEGQASNEQASTKPTKKKKKEKKKQNNQKKYTKMTQRHSEKTGKTRRLCLILEMWKGAGGIMMETIYQRQ